MPANAETAAAFRGLHAGPAPLVLANAWDALSARVVEAAGAKAVATSSAAVAWAHGFADGHHLPVERLAVSVAEIVRVVRVPVTVDSEAGYADDPAAVGDAIATLIDAGAVGINLEDGREPTALHARKIAAARAAAARAGVDLFINARIDVYLKQLVPPEAAVEDCIRRGQAVKTAGASGLFVPGLAKPDEITAIAAAVDLPLNVMVWPGLPPLADLAKLGVRRLSAGGALVHVAMAATRAAASAFLADGDADALLALSAPRTDYNALFNI